MSHAEPFSVPPPPETRAVCAFAVGTILFADLFGPGAVAATESGALGGALTGCIVGQLGLAAVWGALGLGRWAPRLIGSMAFAWLVCIFAWCGLSIAARASQPNWRDVALTLAVLPLVLSFAQLPFWVLRLLLGMRLVADRRGAATRDERRFDLVHLLAATLCIAVALGLARVALTLGPTTAGMELVAVPCTASLVLSVFLALPCLWAAWIARRGTWSILVYACSLTASELIAATMLIASPTAEVFAVTLFFNLAAVGTLHGAFRLLRLAGCEMMTEKRRRAWREAASSATSKTATAPQAMADENAVGDFGCRRQRDRTK